MAKRLLFLLLLAASQAKADAWVSAEGGRSEDYDRLALSGGGDLGKDQAWTLEGSLDQAWSQVPQTKAWVRSNELGAGLTYGPGDAWDLKLDGNYGGDSTQLAFGGGSAALSGYVDAGWFQPSLTANGGAQHFHFGPEESLRQNGGGASVNLGLGYHLDLLASADFYAYDRELYSGATSVTRTSSVPGGGLLGLLPPSALPTTTTTIPGRPAQRDALLPGFPSHDWSMGLSLRLGSGRRLAAGYSQTQIIETNAWDKVVDASWKQGLGASMDLEAAWSKAVEGGSFSPYFSLILTWNFYGDDGA